VVRQLRQLPSAPRVLPRLKQLLGDGNSSMEEVVALVRLDPGIAARVLQMGNSVYFSQGARCYTVDEAVNRLGYDQIYQHVANAVASQVLVRPLAAYALDADELWQQSVACALGAEIIAEHTGAERDIAYTIGLLHGVGLVAIEEWAFRHRPALRLVSRGLPLETCEAERTALGFHNAEVGAALLKLWDFPPVMTEPVRWQYLPRVTAAHQRLACLLHAAKWLRSAACGLTRMEKIEPSVLGLLQLTPRQFEAFVPELCHRLQSVTSLLEPTLKGTTPVPFPAGIRHIPDTADLRDCLAG